MGWATVALLERYGCRVRFPREQTCCGQPLSTAGDPEGAGSLAARFLEVFAGSDPVVAPSASCVATVRKSYRRLLPPSSALDALEGRVHELCEFLVEVLGVERVEGHFPHKVGLQPSCHGLRELGHGTASERHAARPDPARQLLSTLEGIELVDPERPDECCGFGGSFAVTERAVSQRMGRDRVRDHLGAGADVVTATDMSCLAHLDALIRADGSPLRVLHIAEILAGEDSG